MPVHFATTSATSSASTSSLRYVVSRSCRLEVGEALLELRELAVAQLGRALEVGLALGALGLAARLLDRS